MTRTNTYSAVSTKLALLSDKKLAGMLAKTELNSSIGGATGSLEISGTHIFVKKIRLTDLELQPDNRMSTANLFNLPLYYQYGIGSAGFGAWRELTAHVMITNWVLSGACLNFPLMYHWRILPTGVPQTPTLDEIKNVERSVEFWGDSPAIRARIEAQLLASADIVLFLEHMPHSLDKWFSPEPAKIAMVERELQAVTSFMNTHGLLHFDAHFKNILTDGERLYFTDFGLAISDQFELSEEELEFFKRHRNYDLAYVMTQLVHYAPAVESIAKRYGPIAALMKTFNKKLVTETKSAPYPADDLAKAGVAAGLI